jgi:hypothetical protein
MRRSSREHPTTRRAGASSRPAENAHARAVVRARRWIAGRELWTAVMWRTARRAAPTYSAKGTTFGTHTRCRWVCSAPKADRAIAHKEIPISLANLGRTAARTTGLSGHSSVPRPTSVHASELLLHQCVGSRACANQTRTPNYAITPWPGPRAFPGSSPAPNVVEDCRTTGTSTAGVRAQSCRCAEDRRPRTHHNTSARAT